MTVSNRVIFPPKTVGEIKIFSFNFLSKMANQEFVTSAVLTATVWSGNDPSPGAIIDGAYTLDSTDTIVSQRIQGGVLGTIYQLSCLAVTTSGQKLELSGYIAITPEVP